MKTRMVFVKKSGRTNPLFSYFTAQCHLAKNLQNTANFYIRNLRTGLFKANRNKWLKNNKNILLLEESKKKTIDVIEDNGWDFFGIPSEEKWKELKENVLDIDTSSTEVFYRTVNDLIPDLCWESIMIETSYPREAEVVADIFEKYLLPAIKEEFSFTNKP